ncbi:hypothetical protein HIM_10473 [Hirsutella minnesotensis 3608]|uniref:Uncharacterized protein n=1 Tax=Hirsutella minnesotensis 3608 TaxID=1043627 RepID=A0A0F7ZX55_9HYPO|nr:hypothetical protein HIM_10473 [Hirsutella minnesotensis 3608]
MPREHPATVSPEEVRRTLGVLESQRSYRRRSCQRPSPLVRVPHDEILRLLHDMDRQRAEDRSRRREAQYQYTPLPQPPATPSPRPKRPREEQAPPTPPSTQPTRPTRRSEGHMQPPAAPPPKRLRGEQAPATLPPTEPGRPPQRSRPMRGTVQLQRLSVESTLRHYNASFRSKELASSTRSWCHEVPLALQVEASKSFYQAFTDERTLPISHCVFCYRKTPPCELTAMRWRGRLSPSLLRATGTIQECEACLPLHEGARVDVCRECRVSLDSGRLPKACSVNNMAIGCEHRYPEELDGLSPVEERLIALHTPFGYITRFTVDNKTRSGISYRKHVKGHLVVFPNKVDDLVTTVLPHPLLQAIENIHVSWSGSGKPGSADVRHLLQVRKSRVAAALAWLQRNNPLYENVTINQAEMDGWQYADRSSVPTVIMDRMRREEPSTVERTQTDHIVPDTDRGLEGNSFRSIDELVDSINPAFAAESCDADNTPSNEQNQPSPGEPATPAPDSAALSQEADTVCETSTSGMFPLDGPAAFAETDKLSFLADIVNSNPDPRGSSIPCVMQVQTIGDQPFIRVERGADFADNLHEDFFPRTFPKLFPWGKGDPKSKCHSSHSPQSDPADRHPNHSLSYWARYVLQRHGGRFATHPVFCFLVFNTLLRSSNRRISMVRVAKDNFHRFEQAYANLTEDRLKRAEAEMRETRTTSDPDISLLLRELSIFGHAQPLSNESRLLMQRKVQAVNIWAGMPAIWITISPNDINNPVKMKLAVHRLHDYESAKELLADLREKHDRTALSTMDPVSSAIFFHREVSLFFEKYVNTGQESIFGKVSHYYATVETNERGSLHLHGLLWLHGNMRLPNLMDDMANPAEEAYRGQVIRYVDSVFHECLDEDAGKAVRQQRKPIHAHPSRGEVFSEGVVEQGADQQRRTACRFKAPWKIVEETGFTEDGLLQIRRNHPLVNRYNKSLAVGLRHNHDVSMILTKTKGLAMVYYITNYATKLDTPMWKRIALAAEVARQLREAGGPSCRAPDPTLRDDRQQAVLNESRQFLMRAANRIFSERQLSAVEVCYHLLGYDTDFTNMPHWSFLNLTALYWTIFRLWAQLRHQAGELTDGEQPAETIPLRQGGLYA